MANTYAPYHPTANISVSLIDSLITLEIAADGENCTIELDPDDARSLGKRMKDLADLTRPKRK